MKMFASRLVGSAMLCVATAAAAQPQIQVFEISPATYTMHMELPPGTPEAYRKYFVPTKLHGTLRFRFAVSAGGRHMRVRLSNELGTESLKIEAASIGIAADGVAAQAGSIRPLTFGGKTGVTISPGAPILSDPLDFAVTPLTELVASVFVDQEIISSPLGGAKLMVEQGNAVADAAFSEATPAIGRPIVTGVLVEAVKPAGVIVAMGDSITDGARMMPSQPHGWADRLTRRIIASPGRRLAVVTAGIGGNRVVRDGWGPSALARADRDVFAVPGVSHVILLEGINDIGMAGSTLTGQEPPLDFSALLSGYEQLAVRAHARGVKIFVGTLTPFRGAPYFSEEKERQRLAVNAWLRASKLFDGLIDFEAVLRDPEAPDRLARAYDSGDHLHPSDAGYAAMGDAIPLGLFK